MSGRGLEGVVATSSAISSIIDGVLTYRGINIDELAENATFEEVIHLLWHGELPKKDQLDQLTRDLAEHAGIPEEIISFLKAVPKTGVHPMTVLRTAVSNLAIYDQDAEDMSPEANLRKAIKLMAKTASIVAAYARIRNGQEPVTPKSGYNFSQNFVYMLTGKEPDRVAVEAIDKALILHADHELNASTFSARVTVATLSDIYSGVTAAIGALKGPLHGGANEQVMAMLEQIGDISNVESYIQQKLDNKEKIMGFGHRVYKDGDPRAKHLRKMSKELTALTGEPKWYEMSTKIEDLVVRQKGLKPNVDFYSASVYYSLGIPRDLFTPIFAVSRMSGWTAHIMEQYANNRLIRPRAEYVGPVNAHYVPIDER
ncbi:citrate synthase [Microaerobacter geothermalis]|uniref:citrate synthase n=1 Tax=Microaerobacter geothermalis TaxID=674972 RepID=UPI001F214DF3|nr:citrate synthase [Microaerobacter geothermalis]MCF6092951.1 citrate synthase [Microaerobacter geothermalis]